MHGGLASEGMRTIYWLPTSRLPHARRRVSTEFIAHGNRDDWLPLSMSERTMKELRGRSIPASLVVAEQCRHAFDLFPVGDPLGVGWIAIEQGYNFICVQLGMN